MRYLRRLLCSLASLILLAVAAYSPAYAKPAVKQVIDTGSTCNNAQVSAPQTVLSNTTLKKLGLNDFPDIQLGVTKNSNGTYKFLGTAAAGGDVASHPQRAVALTGTLSNPAAKGVQNVADIKNLPSGYSWQGGGPVYVDPTSGVELQVLHFERYVPNSPQHFYTELHLGVVNPTTNQTTYLGAILTSNLTFAQANSLGASTDMGAPTFVAGNDGYLYMYFRDYLSAANNSYLTNDSAVARAPISDVIAAAEKGTVSPWTKYYNGSWSSTGLGGLSSDVYNNGVHNLWSNAAAYDQALGSTVMVSPISKGQVVLTSSVDGMTNWTAPVPLFSDPDRFDAYMTLVGTSGNPAILGSTFDLYYLQWTNPAQGWSTAQVMQRTVTCSGTSAANTVPLGRYNNAGHHVSTTQPAMDMVALEQKGEYSEMSGGTQLFTTAQPGTHALYSCLVNSQDYYLSTQWSCEGMGTLIQIDGWIYDNATGPSVAIYRCYNATLDDRFISASSTCEGAPNTTNEGILGYAPWVNQILYSQYTNGTDHEETSGAVDPTYTIDQQWIIATAGGTGMQQLFNCQQTVPTGVDYFTSIQPNCEGQTEVSTEGYLYTTPPAAPNTPLYRCYNATTYDNFLSQTSNCNGVAKTTNEGLLGYALTRSY